jgi:hypothetical protein
MKPSPLSLSSLLFLLSLSSLLSLTACKESIPSPVLKSEQPAIFPDYKEVTIPATIAPLNFKATAGYDKIDVLISGSRSGTIRLQNKKYAKIPPKEWARLLTENKEGTLNVTVSLKQSGTWTQYAPFRIHISPWPIDYGLAYRLIAPGYEVYSKMGIYRRDLSDFTQTALIENTLMPGTCINCHSFCAGDPERMSLHLRGEYGATILLNGNETNLYNTKTDQTLPACVYPYWHPSGKYIAYSVNQTQQAFHEIKDERVEVIDLQSDIVVYNVETNELFSCPQLKADDTFETYPSFSPDGRTLYFCSAERKPIPEAYDKLQYSLCRISFDPEAGTFGTQTDTLVNAREINRSVSHPRPSYDGKYLMYAQARYGNFLIWHREADLWLYDLQTDERRELTEVNSPDADSYHSWATNSRWFVFGSRRTDGLYTRPYIASVDEKGNAGKPFLVPQEDPAYYETTLYSFNVPEFITGPVKLNIREVEEKALSKKRIQMRYAKDTHPGR